MKNKLWFLFAALAAGLCGCSGGDGKSGDGPAGSPAMLVGVWGASHMTVEAGGQKQRVDVDASISTFTFHADGTLTEYQNGTTVSGSWSYDSAARRLRLMNPVSDLTARVRSLTSSELILAMSVTEQGVAMRMTVTYRRLDNRSPIRPVPGVAAGLPIMSAILNCKNPN